MGDAETGRSWAWLEAMVLNGLGLSRALFETVYQQHLLPAHALPDASQLMSTFVDDAPKDSTLFFVLSSVEVVTEGSLFSLFEGTASP